MIESDWWGGSFSVGKNPLSGEIRGGICKYFKFLLTEEVRMDIMCLLNKHIKKRG